VVELLLLFCSRKELDIADGKLSLCTEEDMAALQPLTFALVTHNPSASQQVQFPLECP
jgi:hypothetical protein